MVFVLEHLTYREYFCDQTEYCRAGRIISLYAAMLSTLWQAT